MKSGKILLSQYIYKKLDIIAFTAWKTKVPLLYRIFNHWEEYESRYTFLSFTVLYRCCFFFSPQIEGLWQPSVEQALSNQARLPNAQQSKCWDVEVGNRKSREFIHEAAKPGDGRTNLNSASSKLKEYLWDKAEVWGVWGKMTENRKKIR